MDTINFKVEHSDEHNIQILNIFVNNENLVDLIKEFEMQHDPSIAGRYEGLSIYSIYNLKEHFTGRLNENDVFNYQGKTQIIGCNCGEPGCWPLLVKIIEEDEKIIWSEFEQPYRAKESAGGYWNYSNFKSFEFIKNQYEEQLQIVCEKLMEDGNST